MTEPVRVLFFCGERSPWGRAHVEPLLEHDDVELVAVALPDDARWAAFRRALLGADPEPRSLRHRMADMVLGAGRRFGGHHPPPDPTPAFLARLRERGIPVLRHHDANSPDALADYRGREPDLILAAAYPQIFSDAWLREMGPAAYNSHPSLLPRCRGANPIFWALASGETEMGGTIHVLTAELDAGALAARAAVEIGPSEGYHELYARLESLVPELVGRFVAFVRGGDAPVPQDPADATTFRNDRMIHHRLFWSEHSAEELERLVRAADGAAFFWHGGLRVRVLRARREATNRNMTNDVRVPPGTVVDVEDGHPVVATQDGYLILEELATPPLRKSAAFRVGMVLS